MSEETNLHNVRERVTGERLEHQAETIREHQLWQQAFDVSEVMMAVLNCHQQIIYVNHALLVKLGEDDRGRVLGQRVGEAIHCVNSENTAWGCGTSEACQQCQAGQIILNSINERSEQTAEVVIRQKINDQEISLNLKEHVVPINVGEEMFYVISWIDLSDTVHRRTLERIFFHDILNTTGAIRGLLGLFKPDVPDHVQADLDFVTVAFQQMIEEIQFQKLILEAENKELVLKVTLIDSCQLLATIIRFCDGADWAEHKQVKRAEDSPCLSFASDETLLIRVLINMLKNALEATERGGKVSIGCRELRNINSEVEFWVRNDRVVPQEIRHQVFKRTFSTKGVGRGLGTYSMKLMGENYLSGKVGFTSDELEGTTFFIRLPWTNKVPGSVF